MALKQRLSRTCFAAEASVWNAIRRRLKVGDELNPLVRGFGRNQLQRAVQDHIQLHNLGRVDAGGCEIEQLLRQPVDARHLVANQVEEFIPENRILVVLRQQLDEGLDRHQGIADFVSQTRPEQADRSQLLGALGFDGEVCALKGIFHNGSELLQLCDLGIGERPA